MADISQLIAKKTAQDEARTAERQADRANLSELRDAALLEVTTNPELYQKYLDLQGDNMRCSAGNVALTLFQLDKATHIGTTDYWHGLGRYVVNDEMGQGAKVFVPPRDPKRRGYFMGDYYDVSQTTGKPVKAPLKLEDNSTRMETALAALMSYSPVAFGEDTEMEAAAYYDPERMEIFVNPAYSDGEIFSAIATEITYARFHDRGRNRDFSRAEYSLDAESVGYLLCRRFGVACPRPDAGRLRALYEGYEPADRGEALTQLGKVAQDMGGRIDKAVQPRQQEQGRKYRHTR